jgi:UDP-2,3-diacylglucosamine pyrophosphatase LpxH
MNKFRTIVVSDVHLGTKDSKAHLLNDFLKSHQSENLYLLGDIIDGWKIQQNRLKWKNSHTSVIRRILKIAKSGTKVIYIAGNHDEFLRPLVPYQIDFGGVKILNQHTHDGVDGKKYLLVHGDLFDGITRLAPWVSFLGDRAYDVLLGFNSKFNWIRHKFGFGYWSLSKYLKSKVKKAVDFIFKFEKNLTMYCQKRGFDAIICGHIHCPEIKNIDGIWYLNDGDFVESISALVETLSGDWIILHFRDNAWVPTVCWEISTNILHKENACKEWYLEKGFQIENVDSCTNSGSHQQPA